MSKRIDRVDVRAKLPLRRDPYWHRITEGRYVGFRCMPSKDNPKKPAGAGTWLARLYDGERYVYETLGDFATLPEGERYDAAKKAAEAWFQHLDMGGTPERVTVKAACEARVENRRIEKSEAAAADAKGRFERLVYDDPIGKIELAKLAPRHLADWKARVLAKGGARGSYNRNATALRAALNLAYQRRQVASNHAWREELKPLDNAVKRRTLYLDGAKRRKLIECASAEARPFFSALNLLPLRPGELAGMKVENLSAGQRALEISGKTETRLIPLPSEALSHFKACAKGKLPGAWLIARADGSQWKKEAWRDEIKEAVKKAKLPRATVAYTLRHSLITDLVVGGLDLFTVAKISGTSVLMIEKHYGHLQREHARSALEKLALA
jgi:site-specific recombinase XerD